MKMSKLTLDKHCGVLIKTKACLFCAYGNQGGFIFITVLSARQVKTFLVVRRAFDKLSGIIYEGRFNGFEMLLIDTRTDTVSMRENFFYQFR